MKRIAGILLLLVALLLALVAALPFSEVGSRLLVALASRVAPLEVDYGGGQLFGAFHLERLALDLPSVAVELTDVRVDLDPACLWRSEFCLRSLTAAAVRVTVPESDDQGAQEDGSESAIDHTPLLIPVRVLAPRVALGHTEVRWPGGGWNQGPAELALEISSGGIRVSGARIARPILSLEASDDNPATGPVELPALWLPFDLVLDGVQLMQPGWHVAGATDGLEAMAFSARWQGEQLTLSQLTVADPRWGDLALTGALTFSGEWPLEADARLDPGPALQWRDLAPGALQVKAGGTLSQLELGLASDGEQRLEVTGRLDVLAPELPFELDASASWGQPLALDRVAPLPEDFPPVLLTSPLALAGQGSLAEQALQVTLVASGLGYNQLAVELRASHRDSTVEIEQLSMREAPTPPAPGRARSAERGLPSSVAPATVPATPPAADAGLATTGGQHSALFGKGSLTLGDTLAADIHLSTPGLSLPAVSENLFGRVKGALDLALEVSPEQWSVELAGLSLDGEVNGLPASASGALSLDSTSYLAGGDLQFDVNGAQGTVVGGNEGDEAGGNESGAVLEIEVADLGRWAQESRGSLTARASLPGGATRATFDAVLEGAGWEDWQLEQATLEGYIDLAAPDRFQARLVGTGLNDTQFALSRFTLEGSGDGGTLDIQLTSEGDATGDLQLAASRDGEQWRGELQPTEWATPLGRWRLPEAVDFTLAGERLRVADHCWRGGDASLCLKDADLGASGTARVALEGPAGGLLAPLLAEGVQLEAALSAEANARWGGGDPARADVRLSVGEGELSQQRGEGARASWDWDALDAELDYRAGELALRGQLQRRDRAVIELRATLPADRSQALEGRVAVDRMDLSTLQPFAPQLSRLEGILDGGWDLAGTADRPLAHGRLRWSEGALTLVNSPTELTGLTLDLDLRGDNLQLNGEGLLGGGKLALSGDVRSAGGWGVDLNVRGEHNRLVYPPSVEVVVSPDLHIEARPEQVALKGTIQVEQGTVAQEQLPEGSIGLSRDVVQVDYTGKVIEGEQPIDTSMDIRVAIDDSFRVVGHGLDARVGGDLRLQQQAGRPLQLYGNLNVVGGEFRAYGQRLEVMQGRISFAGVPENPDLDLRAEREIPLEQLTAGVRVAGTLEAPELTVYTDPPSTQTEALSYLIRGRGLDSGAGADGAALALSLGTGVVNRSAVVEGLNSLPGLSGIEFGAEGSADDTAATVSGYLGERIYLSYGVGLYEPVNVLTARLYLQTRLWLEVVSRLESSVDLYYSFDID